MFGKVFEILSQPPGIEITKWFENIPNSGIIYFRGFLGTEYIAIRCIEGLVDVLTRNSCDFEKPSSVRRYIDRFAGAGLVTDEGPVHKKHRTLLGPAFQQQQIAKLDRIISSKAISVVKSIAHLSDAEFLSNELDLPPDVEYTVDIYALASRFSLDVGCIKAFGIDINTLGNPDHEVFKSYHNLFLPSKMEETQRIWHMLAPEWITRMMRFANDKKMDTAIKTVRNFVQNIVDDRIKHKSDSKTSSYYDILSLLLNSGQFSAKSCTEQLVLMLTAA